MYILFLDVLKNLLGVQMDNRWKILTGLWKGETKTGIEYLRGTVREPITLDPGTKLMIFPSTKKKSDADPDYLLKVVAKDESKDSKNIEMDFV